MPVTKRESLIYSVASHMVYARQFNASQLSSLSTVHCVVLANFRAMAIDAGYVLENEGVKETRLLIAICRKALEMKQRQMLHNKI